MSYEFHGIRWMNDDELDPDSPERRGPGWAHAYVPVISPEGEATATAHVPIFMPRVYRELKRFALQIYKAAGGTTNNVELSGWWSNVKKAFKKIAKIVAESKVLRAVAEKGLQAAVPGGASVSDGAAKVLEDLVSKYRGGSTEAAKQIKGLLEKANRGSAQDAKILDVVRREYLKQQAVGLPALMATMASGDVVVYDPIYGAKRKMTAATAKKVAQQRKAAPKRKAAPARRPSTSPLRNSPTGPKAPGSSVQQMRQPFGSSLQPMRPVPRPVAMPYQQGMPAQIQQPYPYGYPQQGYPQQGYPQNYGYPQQGGPQQGGSQYDSEQDYDPEQDANDEADLQEAAEENLARIATQQNLEDDTDSEMEGSAGANLSLTTDEAAQWRQIPQAEQDRLKRLKPEEIQARLRTMVAKQKTAKGQQQAQRKRQGQEGQYRSEQQKKERERQGAQIRRDREQQAQRSQGRVEVQKRKMVEQVQRSSQAARRLNERRAEMTEYEDKITELEDQLERRDLASDKRNALEHQRSEYQARLQAADKDMVKAKLEAQQLKYAHRESMAKIRQAAPQDPAPVIYDEERNEDLDTDDPLVREALAQMQQNQDVEDENNGEG